MKRLTPVFYVSLVLALMFILWGVGFPDGMSKVTISIQSFIQDRFGWFYLLSATLFLVFCIYLIFSRYRHVKLGDDDEEPQYSYVSWFAMLFSAGMGIGLVFWGVAEPVSHFFDPPMGEAGTSEAANEALRYSFFHWGFHPWAIYSVLGLSLAYVSFRRKAPQIISETLRPIFGDGVDGIFGKTVDVIAILATVFGVATSLGFGAIQIAGGLSFTTSTENTFAVQLLIIVIVTVLYMISTITGLNKGIKYLSNVNIFLAFLLMIAIFVISRPSFIMNVFTSSFGGYIQHFPTMSLSLNPFGQSDWIEGWTIFYWAWWIAWAPFVGTFIARISRGRTIREFILGVLLVPTIFSALWFSVFGGTGISLDMFGDFGLHNIIAEEGKEVALFSLLQNFPYGWLLSVIAICLISTFFITSADSATFVLGMQSMRGDLNPRYTVKIVWGVIQSASAAVLIWSGGLNALQTASIIAALPFSIVLLLMCASFIRALQKETVTADQKWGIAEPSHAMMEGFT